MVRRLVAAAGLGFAALSGCTSTNTVTTSAEPTTPDDGTNDGGDADAGAPPAAPMDVCAQFVACVYETTPDQASGAEASYGANGACWKTEPEDRCRAGCKAGLEGLHQEHPDAAACALCLSDTDCSGATPACDARKGECAPCTTNTHCKSPGRRACATETNTCVACTADADCKGSAHVCDSATHTCVECTVGTQCSSRTCNDDHTCCVPSRSCLPGDCGAAWTDGCNNALSCGSCAVGTCDNGTCTNAGAACTPGAAGDCAAREACMFDAKKQAYSCHDPNSAPFDGSSCSGPINNTYCYEPDGEFYVCSLEDAVHNWHCQRMCLTTADCGGGHVCQPYFDKTIISAAKPGYCN